MFHKVGCQINRNNIEFPSAQQKKYHDKKMGFGTFELRVHDDITSRVSFSEILIKIKFSS